MMTRPSSWIRLPLCAAAIVVGAGTRGSADELDEHLTRLQTQVDDGSLQLGRRAQLASEMVAALDRAARAATDGAVARKYWSRARGVLDNFNRAHPQQPDALAFEVQSAVLAWAEAANFVEQADDDPAAASSALASARTLLDTAIERLRSVAKSLPDPATPLAQNARFRLARALVDRVRIENDGMKPRAAVLDEALDTLAKPTTLDALKPHVLLLRGMILGLRGDVDAGLKALDDAAKIENAPALEIDAARREILLASNRFEAARKLLDPKTSPLDPTRRAVARLRVDLAERAVLPDGPARRALEAAVFQTAAKAKSEHEPEARALITELARAVDTPGKDQTADDVDLLASGALALGDRNRAARLEEDAARRAENANAHPLAAALRLKAGALWFQTGDFARAEAILSRVADDPDAGVNRPRASLLRVLALGRARPAGNSANANDANSKLRAALESHIKAFPADPTSDEARRQLADILLARGEIEPAKQTLTAIEHGRPHWVDSRRTLAKLARDEIEAARITADPVGLDRLFQEARRFLNSAAAKASTPEETRAIKLERVALELLPDGGRGDEALSLCRQLLAAPAEPAFLREAEALRVGALVLANRYQEAEQAARRVAAQSSADELVAYARRLDHATSDADSDIRLRRLGDVIEIILAPVLAEIDHLPPAVREEVELRRIRAFVYRGDQLNARRALSNFRLVEGESNDARVRELGDAYLRIGAYGVALDVERLRTRQLRAGSPLWFEARYLQALAAYRSGDLAGAGRLIEATSILHPDLGGGGLKTKYERLMQRIRSD